MSPKTLTGQELQLDDGPARDSELFLVDGNNLAYRAFFALPEELATSDGFPTNALLGFTNMLFKLLSDYRPKGVAVAWDSTPTQRIRGEAVARCELLRQREERAVGEVVAVDEEELRVPRGAVVELQFLACQCLW